MKFYFRFCLYLLCVSFSVNKKDKQKGMEGMIVGGVTVDISKFPAAGRVINQGSMCGCSVLNSFSVLTAAHCFDQNTDVEDITVHLGVTFLYDPKTMVRDATDLRIHEDYNKERAFACDIAIVFVAQAIVFGKHVKKAVLIDSDAWKNKQERNIQVVGWGWTKYGGEISTNLKMASMRYVPLSTCSKLHNTSFSKDMLCLYGEGKDDSCRGDSGGGAYWNGQIIGLVSCGDGCAEENKPSVYANVYKFRSWLKNALEQYARKGSQECGNKISNGIQMRTAVPED